MADAEDDEVNASEEEGGSAAQASKKKKRRPKKKGGAADAAAPEEDVAPLEAAGVEAPVEGDGNGVAGDAPAEAEGDEEEEGAPQAGSGKKKKKKKKSAAAPDDAGAEDAGAGEEAPPASVPLETVAAVEEGDEEGDEEADAAGEGQEAAAATKKKKKKPKKKGGAAGVVALVGDCRARLALAMGTSDEEFLEWAKSALKASSEGRDALTPEQRLRPAEAFFGFKYAGPLRAAHVTPQMRFPPDWNCPDYGLHPEGVPLSEKTGPKEVPVLEGEKLQTMREACRLGREVLDIAARYMKPGVTGDEIDRVVFQACMDRKIYPSPLNYYRFPKSVCVSPNEIICHGIPDCRPIEEGDIINLDVSIYHKGFHSDLNETFFVGECDEDAHRLVRTAYMALYAASQLIRPGTFYRDLGNAIHTEADKSNCAVVRTYCGHGVGELFHGPPKVPHYRKNKAVGVMKPGHVFTVEPMLNLGTNGSDRTWPDNWTASTKDGKRSAQFEHTFLVTETGVDVLTARRLTDTSCMPAWEPAMFQL